MSSLQPSTLIHATEPDDMLVDYMGLPLKPDEVRAIVAKARKHLRKSPETLSAYANKVLAERHPTMASQMAFKAEDYA